MLPYALSNLIAAHYRQFAVGILVGVVFIQIPLKVSSYRPSSGVPLCTTRFTLYRHRLDFSRKYSATLYCAKTLFVNLPDFIVRPHIQLPTTIYISRCRSSQDSLEGTCNCPLEFRRNVDKFLLGHIQKYWGNVSLVWIHI